jgi:hypothetical protein
MTTAAVKPTGLVILKILLTPFKPSEMNTIKPI